MNHLAKVEGHSELRKDMHSGAVINTDEEALFAARKRKKEILESKEKMEILENKVEWLEIQLKQLLEERLNGR